MLSALYHSVSNMKTISILMELNISKSLFFCLCGGLMPLFTSVTDTCV